MTKIRKRGIALVETNKGILVVAGRRKIFSLPGGEVNKRESRKGAAIRELREETNLKTKSIKFLFKYSGRKWKTNSGKIVRNHAKVFLIRAYGKAKPRNEVRYLTYYKPNSKLKVSKSTKHLIQKYYLIKN